MAYNLVQWVLSVFLIIFSLGVIFFKQPVHAAISFLGTLITLAVYYLQLSAPFIAITQVLVYAGAILVIFMFVIILFQDAHEQLALFKSRSNVYVLISATVAFLLTFFLIGADLIYLEHPRMETSQEFGTAQTIGRLLYVDFFFPFESMVVLFLIALMGSVYIGKRER